MGELPALDLHGASGVFTLCSPVQVAAAWPFLRCSLASAGQLPLPPSNPPRYNQHTKHCPHCSGTLRAINVGLGVAAVAAVLAAATAVAAFSLGGAPALSRVAGGCGAVLLAAALLAAPLLNLRPKFLGGTPYVHADH